VRMLYIKLVNMQCDAMPMMLLPASSKLVCDVSIQGISRAIHS